MDGRRHELNSLPFHSGSVHSFHNGTNWNEENFLQSRAEFIFFDTIPESFNSKYNNKKTQKQKVTGVM